MKNLFKKWRRKKVVMVEHIEHFELERDNGMDIMKLFLEGAINLLEMDALLRAHNDGNEEDVRAFLDIKMNK